MLEHAIETVRGTGRCLTGAARLWICPDQRFSLPLAYATEGTYHEAGHAIMYAYLRLPFYSVTIKSDAEGGHTGKLRTVPRGKPYPVVQTNRRGRANRAIATAAGRVATDIHEEKDPSMIRFEESDREDQEQIRRIGVTCGENMDDWFDLRQ
jgi:hypothetical protein